MIPSILSFSSVTVRSSPEYETGLSNICFEIGAGDLLLVRIERENERLPLADASQGLLQTDRGTVTFQGNNWMNLSADRSATERGRIGRLFDDEGWIDRKSVV